MRTRTTWREKLERIQEPKVVRVPPRMQKRFGTGTMLIPRPLDVDALIRRVPMGKLITVSRIRQVLAATAGADVTCPLTTGIFLRIAAEAAEERAEHGDVDVTPYWRVVRDDGALFEKFPGGIRMQAERLSQEGHTVIAGKKPRVRIDDEILAEV